LVKIIIRLSITFGIIGGSIMESSSKCPDCGKPMKPGLVYCDECNDKEKQKPKNCWEFKNCPKERRERCDIYKYGYGDKCWISINDVVIKGCGEGKKNCFDCPWYKINNPDL
jgi:hypothetical protein